MELESLIRNLNQPHLLTGVDQLSNAQRTAFIAQLAQYPASLLAFQRQSLKEKKQPSASHEILPWNRVFRSGSLDHIQYGEELLAQGKVGSLILAGGQGSRLGCGGPKGTCAVTRIKKKSLFQLFCERTNAASKRYGKKLPLCLMTSPLNHAQTEQFFKDHDFFGLLPDQMTFFQQGMLPFLDDAGNWLLEHPGKLAVGPDGNGRALHRFVEAGLFETWRELGIEYLNVIVVDNALADPFDPEVVGLTAATQAQITLKAVERLLPDEKMGVLVEKDGRLKVIEYFEFGASTPCPFSSTSLFCFEMSCLSSLPSQLPWHFARKSASVVMTSSEGWHYQEIPIWKCETFLFDLLEAYQQVRVLVYPREEIYAPLKNATGLNSFSTVQEALLQYDRLTLHKLTGSFPQVEDLELDPAFYYPDENLRRQWLGKEIPLQGGYLYTRSIE